MITCRLIAIIWSVFWRVGIRIPYNWLKLLQLKPCFQPTVHVIMPEQSNCLHRGANLWFPHTEWTMSGITLLSTCCWSVTSKQMRQVGQPRRIVHCDYIYITSISRVPAILHVIHVGSIYFYTRKPSVKKYLTAWHGERSCILYWNFLTCMCNLCWIWILLLII